MKRLNWLFLSIILLLLSCQNDDNDTTVLDRALTKTLIQNSENGSIDFFKMPASDNFDDIPQDPKNPLSKEKIELGKNLFHETAFATEGKFPITTGEYSCASCHHAASGFQSGLAQGLGEGGEGFGFMGESRKRNLLCAPELCDVQPLRSPTILNGAYQSLMLWNGQFGGVGTNLSYQDQWTEDTPKEVNNLGLEGLETQAIAGLTVHRIGFSKESIESNGYKKAFDTAFPEMSEEERYSLNTAGLAIAAYERTVMSSESPFQKYLNGDQGALSDNQKKGAIYFFGKANCASCHTGPALNSMTFHALGMNEFNQDEVIHFNPADPARFGRFSFTQIEEDKFKFKTPTLYNLNGINFLGHGASMHSVRDVIEYKNKAKAENPEVSSAALAEDFVPLGLNNNEINSIVDFIENGLQDSNLERYVPTSLPSGKCFPNNDDQSREDLGCD